MKGSNIYTISYAVRMAIALALGTQRVEPIEATRCIQRATLSALHALAVARICLVLTVPEASPIPGTPAAPLVLDARRAIRVQARALITTPATLGRCSHTSLLWEILLRLLLLCLLFVISDHITLLSIVHQMQALVERIHDHDRLAEQTLGLASAPDTLVLIVLSIQI
jgi:hypothetical protein